MRKVKGRVWAVDVDKIQVTLLDNPDTNRAIFHLGEGIDPKVLHQGREEKKELIFHVEDKGLKSILRKVEYA